MSDKIEEKIINESVKGVKSFLSLVCKPALSEFGYLVSDKVREWRLNNIVKILEKSKGKLGFDPTTEKITISPRVALKIIEEASVIEDEDLQEMWAGLFSSSCSSEDDENIIYIDLLKKMTSSQARIVNYLVEISYKIKNSGGDISTAGATLHRSKIMEYMGISDVYRMDSELVFLESLGLVVEKTRFPTPPSDPKITLSTTKLALNLYVKCTGKGVTVDEYYKNNLITPDDYKKLQDEHMSKLVKSITDNKIE